MKNDENKIQRQIELKKPVSRVWKALTDYREFGDWFRVALEAPFAVGKEASGKILHPGYEHVTWRATIVKMEPEKIFAFTWHPYGIDKERDYSNEPPTLVEFRLEETATGTRLTLTETGFDKVPADRRLEAFRMNSEGWTIQMKNIEAHVSKG